MRRESSAQNPPTSKSSSSGPRDTNNATSVSFATTSVGAATIPTSGTAKESDIHSVYTNTTALSRPSEANSSQLGQDNSDVEYLRDLVQKRIITLSYIRNIHEGRSHWFHTILISRADLEREFSNDNPEIQKRTTRFAILGMSISNLLDINSPQDLLRGLIQTISEYDQNKDNGDKSRMRQSRRLFRPIISKRGGHEHAISFSDSSDTPYLTMPHIPFPLDYNQTLLSLLDVISEVYNKISKILGPSPFANPSQHMMGSLGLLSSHPGDSYIISGDNTPAGVANATQHSNMHPSNGTSGLTYGGVLENPPPILSASFGESLLKIDVKIRKITSTLLKELDTFAQNAIKDELASLDPLLNPIGPIKSEAFVKPGGGRRRGRIVNDPSKELASVDLLLSTVGPIKPEPESFLRPGGGRGHVIYDPSNESTLVDLPLNTVDPNIEPDSFFKPGGGRGYIIYDSSNELTSVDPLLDTVDTIKPETFSKPGGGRIVYDPNKGV